MTDVLQPPHLTPRDLVDTLRGAVADRRERWIHHLCELCPDCWGALRRGLGIRLFTRHDSDTPPDPLAYALCRLLAYYAPASHARTKADLLRPLYPRHRHALVTAHERPFGLVRLALEESQVVALPLHPVSYARFTRSAVVRAAVKLVPAADEKHPGARDDLEAWAQAGLARAGCAPGFSGSEETVDRPREHLERALAAAGRGTGGLLLRVTLHELRGLTGDESAGLASLDQALELVSSDGPADLRAELLLHKARRLDWEWAEQARTCREALGLLDVESPPGLRVGILDRLGAAESGLGHVDAARSALMQAQRFSEQAGETPLDYCRRWEMLARLPSDGSDTVAGYRAAILAYRSLEDGDLREGATRLLVDLALFLLNRGEADAFGELEQELARELEPGSYEVRRVIEAAQGKGVCVPALVALESRNETATSRGKKLHSPG